MSPTIIIVVGLILAGLLWFFFRPPFGKNIVRLNTDQRVVALTYDDGPNPPYTERLLDVLAKHNVKATFLHDWESDGKAYPETVKSDYRRRSPNRQSFTYSHPLLGFLPPFYVQRQIERTDDLIRQHGITEDRLYFEHRC